MFNVSLVKLEDVNNLEQASTLLNDSRILDDTVEDDDWPDHEILTKRWNTMNQNDLLVQQLMTGTRENVRFIFVEGYNERPKRKDKWFEDTEREIMLLREERINITQVKSVFFEYNGSTYLAPFMPPGRHLNTFTSDLLPEEIWGRITRNPAEYAISNDFYYWLLNAFTRGNRVISITNPSLSIRSWTGFLGTTQDFAHRLAGEGDRISAILGTLAFLFMNDPFRALSLSIQYENERIPVVLGQEGNLQIYEFEYEGRYSNAYFDDSRRILLTILMFTNVLPALLNKYEQSRTEGTWNAARMNEFTNWIGDEIIMRVRNALDIE